jgi:SAM-dependent methyltransferase
MPEERPYLDPYLRAAEDFGPGFDALLWHSPKAQQTRFRVISQMLNTAGRTLADIGCGNADLLVELHRRGRDPAVYIGVDAVPQTLAHARENAQNAGIGHAQFADHDFVRDEALPARLVDGSGIDTIVFCGSLNTLPQQRALGILGRFWDAMTARPDAVLLFNFLSDRHDRARTPATPPAVRFDAVEMVHWALDRTPLVTFRHEYLGGHDATVCMRTSPRDKA